jgi:hypothetical protein
MSFKLHANAAGESISRYYDKEWIISRKDILLVLYNYFTLFLNRLMFFND